VLADNFLKKKLEFDMNNQVKTIAGMVLSMMTGALITLFLFGNIIEIPRGTHEGGLIAATTLLLHNGTAVPLARREQRRLQEILHEQSAQLRTIDDICALLKLQKTA
jgi:hypothetical protein